MKKIILSSALALVCIAFTQAQESESSVIGKTTFGVKAGINQVLVRSSSTNADLGYFFGLFSETRLSEKWSIQNELLFTANNEVTRFTVSDLNLESTRDLTFFEVPLHLKYHATDKVSLFAGPKLSFLAGQEDADNVGLALEAGIQWDFTKKFFLEARYSQDLFSQNTLSVDNGIIRQRRDRALNQLRLGVGFKFN